MFEAATEFAHRIKFSGDIIAPLVDRGTTFEKYLITNTLLKDELCISEYVTPKLHNSVLKVTERLRINQDRVMVFVYPSATLNASCLANDEQDCIIRISSALIDILDTDEFEFVIAHELGHFLLSHYALGESDDSYEYFMLRRAQEISSDRLGLLGSGSLKAALSALLKTASGLSNHHLKFDFGSFVSQLQKASSDGFKSGASSHPGVTIRCRALLWFSMSSSFANNESPLIS